MDDLSGDIFKRSSAILMLRNAVLKSERNLRPIAVQECIGNASRVNEEGDRGAHYGRRSSRINYFFALFIGRATTPRGITVVFHDFHPLALRVRVRALLRFAFFPSSSAHAERSNYDAPP